MRKNIMIFTFYKDLVYLFLHLIYYIIKRLCVNFNLHNLIDV